MSRFPQSKVLRAAAVSVVACMVVIWAAYYPHDTDAPLSPEELAKSRRYYAQAYQPAEAQQAASEYETRYIRLAKEAADRFDITGQVAGMASQYGLTNGSVLDVGSGRGYLQDVVSDYTGLDISTTVHRFYHKRFVVGSATAMPFADNSFDGGWSVWVLEHVPYPEQALSEIRRVMKNGAVFLMYPAWNCTDWAAPGYQVRPYSDFDWSGKLAKATIPVRSSAPFRAAAMVPTRLARTAVSWFGPTRLHYRRLEPNYKQYWVADSDALNSIDRHEMMLWFRSRGDECLNCEGADGSPFARAGAWLVVRIRK